MVWVNVEVDLDEVSDEDIKDEYNERNLGSTEEWDEHVELEKAYRLEWEGKRAEAFEILWRMCLVKLNKVV